MATASRPSTRLSASDEPPQKKTKTDQYKMPIATPLASTGDGLIQYNDLKDEIIQARKRRLERGEPELTVAEFLEKYSGEPRAIPLDQILTSMFNRNGQKLNGSQVKHLMTMFAMTSKNGGEDFSRYRYKVARLHEIEPHSNKGYSFDASSGVKTPWVFVESTVAPSHEDFLVMVRNNAHSLARSRN